MTELQLGKYEFYPYEDDKVLKKLKKTDLDGNEDLESLRESLKKLLKVKRDKTKKQR